MKTKIHILKDERKLAYMEFGDPKGIPVFYAHGGPGSRLEGEWFHEVGIRKGFKIISTDRPGHGESSYQEGRSHLDYARDIADLADALNFDKFGVIGWSGGGMPTTICAYAIPERLLFDFSFAGYTNWQEMSDAPSYLAGGREDVENSSNMYKQDIEALRSSLEQMEERVKNSPEEAYYVIISQMNKTDKAIAEIPEFKALFMKSQKEAFKQGALGPAHDAYLHYHDWGFKLKDIAFPIHVFHGTEDGLVPIEYAQHLRDTVQNCTLHIWEGEGHLAPQEHLNEIFDIARKEIAIQKSFQRTSQLSRR